MSLLASPYTLPDEQETELGIVAQWWTKKLFPQSLDEIDLKDFFEVKNVQDRGEYYDKPKDATGVILVSSKKLSVVAGWRNEKHDGPYQVYSEQEKDTIGFHFVGDTKVVFFGWI